MDDEKRRLTETKYRLPYHWMRDPLVADSLLYFGYMKLVLEQLPPRPARVFDAGCGDGRMASEFLAAGYETTGVDLIPLLVRYAEALVPGGRFFNADLRDDLVAELSLAQGSFDAVVLVEVYEHVPPGDCPKVLANLTRLLRPGGRAIVSVPSKQLPMSKLHYRHFDQGEIEAEIAAAGLVIRSVARQHRLDGWTSWLLSPRVEQWLTRGLTAPAGLRHLRRKLWMRHGNAAGAGTPCGRYILTATKPQSVRC